MILNPYHCIVEMRYFSEMRIYFKAHFALLSDAQYWANTSNALECCNRFTHNGRSNGNLAHKATLPLELQYHNPAKSSFVCVSAIHPPSPPWTVEVPQDRAAATGAGSILWGSTTYNSRTTSYTTYVHRDSTTQTTYNTALCCSDVFCQHCTKQCSACLIWLPCFNFSYSGPFSTMP